MSDRRFFSSRAERVKKHAQASFREGKQDLYAWKAGLEVALADNPQVADAIKAALEIINERGESQSKTSITVDIKKLKRGELGALSTAVHHVENLNKHTTFKSDVFDRRHHQSFSISRVEYTDLCRQYEVPTRPGLRHYPRKDNSKSRE